MEWWMNAIIAICGYLLGMAFAGSFLGRKWMGTVDIALHRLFKREVTTGKYLYWKHFCGINDPPRPKNLGKPKKLGEMILSKFIFGAKTTRARTGKSSLRPSAQELLNYFFGATAVITPLLSEVARARSVLSFTIIGLTSSIFLLWKKVKPTREKHLILGDAREKKEEVIVKKEEEKRYNPRTIRYFKNKISKNI